MENKFSPGFTGTYTHMNSLIFLISQNVIMQCDVCGAVIYRISNKSKYLKTEMRYATDVKTNLYNWTSSFK